MATWNCINRQYALDSQEHYVFVDGAARVAIADHTIRDFNDPSTTEDGLLLWDGNVGKFEYIQGEGLSLVIGAYLDDGYHVRISIAPEVAQSIENATGKKVAPPTINYGPFKYSRPRVQMDEAEFIAEARKWVEESTRS